MTLDAAIQQHRKPLLHIVATLFAMLGIVEGETVERLSPSVYRAVLRLLRPAESAVRRLIVVIARNTVFKQPVPRSTVRRARSTARQARRTRIAFKLFDPRQRIGSAFRGERRRLRITLQRGPEPRIRVLDVGFDPRVPLFRMAAPPVPQPLSLPDEWVSAVRITRRIAALKSALDDLPRQARRYLRWQAKPLGERRPQLSSALRPGPPPGHRKNALHKVDEILAECHWLARRAMLSNTS